MTKKIPQIDRIVRVLASNNTGAGITISAVAKAASVPRATVSKRVHDLRESGARIYTNYRQVNGRRKAYYRMAV